MCVPVGPASLEQPDDRILDVLALAHHEVGELVDDDHDVRQAVRRIHPRLVERLDVAGRGTGEPAIAVLHLAHRPLERGLRPLGLRDHRDQQVRQAVVAGELDPLEVHQDHPGVVRGRIAQQAGDQRIDHHALAGAGGARDQQVGHLGQVHGLGPARDVAPQREGQPRSRCREVHLVQDPAQGDDVELADWDLDPAWLCPGSWPRSDVRHAIAMTRPTRLDPGRA